MTAWLRMRAPCDCGKCRRNTNVVIPGEDLVMLTETELKNDLNISR